MNECNMSFTADLSSVDEIGAGEAELNTSAPRCGLEVFVGFEPTIF